MVNPSFLRITKVYDSETYDYPTQIQESIAELGTTIGHNLTSFAATNLKGTNLPTPTPTAPPAAQHKTLPHALGRAATTAAHTLGPEDKLGRALAEYAQAWEKIASAREVHDDTVKNKFLAPWQTTLATSITVAMKARQAVRVSRLELDAAKQTCASFPSNFCIDGSPHVAMHHLYSNSLKNATPARQEHARLEVENAEDDLVQKTEVAITLMKAVLDNVRRSPLVKTPAARLPPWCHRAVLSMLILISFPV